MDRAEGRPNVAELVGYFRANLHAKSVGGERPVFREGNAHVTHVLGAVLRRFGIAEQDPVDAFVRAAAFDEEVDPHRPRPKVGDEDRNA